MDTTHNRVPIPDPTLLTTAQLLREIENLRNAIDIRLDGMDRAVKLFQENLSRVPTDTDKQVKHLHDLAWARMDALTNIIENFPISRNEVLMSLRNLYDEKFHSIAIQFAERDIRSEQTSRDSKVAVDAALQAAKEAVGEQNRSSALAIAKSEAATTKQIDQQGLLISTSTAGLNDKIEDIKARLTLIEGKGSGIQTMWGYIFGAGGFVLAIVGLFELFMRHAV